MRMTSATTDRMGKNLQQRVSRIRRWAAIVSGIFAFLGVLATAVSGQPIELVSPSEEIDGQFGWSVSGISDLDGDGRGDVVVGAAGEEPGGSPTNAGRVYIFSGLDGTLQSTLVSPNQQTYAHFGNSVSSIPDIDSDGRDDVIVAAGGEDPPVDAGRAYIFSSSGGTVLSTLMSPNAEAGGEFGCSVSGIPDANGDGRGDVVVGAHYEQWGGRAYIFSGSDGTLLSTLVSPNEETSGRFGNSVCGILDVNGDGRGDVIVGAPFEDPGASPDNAGRAYVFSGSDGTVLSTLISPNDQYYGCFGISVSGIPDVDGDGRCDVIVGAYFESPSPGPSNAGCAYTFSGSDGALLNTFVSPNGETDGRFGNSVSGIPDLDGDSRGDVVVGAPREDPGTSPTDAGRAYIFSGSGGTLLSTLTSPNAQSDAWFGMSVSGIPDVDGDARRDVVVGAQMENPGGSPQHAGRAYVFFSSLLSVEDWIEY